MHEPLSPASEFVSVIAQPADFRGNLKLPGFLEAPKPGSVLARGDAPAMPAPKKYPDESRKRAVGLVFESGRPVSHVAQDLGIHKEALRKWVRQAEADRAPMPRACYRPMCKKSSGAC